MNGIEINKLLAGLSAAYQNFQINEMTPVVWAEVLDGADYKESRTAVIEFMKSPSAFPPTPGQILEIICENRLAEIREEGIKRLELEHHTRQLEYKKTEANRAPCKEPFKLRDTLSPEGLNKFLALIREKEPTPE